MITVMEAVPLRKFDQDWSIDVEVGQYANGRIAIRLTSRSSEGWQEPFATLTVNLPDEECPPNEVFVKDYAENHGLAAWAIEHGIIMPEPEGHASSGYVRVPRYQLTLNFYRRAFDVALAAAPRGVRT